MEETKRKSMGDLLTAVRRIGFWRYEKERGDRLKCAIIREHPSAAQKGSQPRLTALDSPSYGRGSRGHCLLPMEGGAPKGRRLDGESGMKKSEEIISSTPFARAPYPPLRGPPSPRGEGGEQSEPNRVLAV